MQISQNGINLIKEFEGLFLKTYDDGVGVLTIGYGHTNNVTWGQVINECQAEDLLRSDLNSCCHDVTSLISSGIINFKVNQNMFDALVSFNFNLGIGNLITLVRDRDINVVAEKMLLYVNAGGRALQGLVRRRQAERELFLKPIQNEIENLRESVKMELIRKGENSKRVKIVQALLNEISDYNLFVDGIFGQNTLDVIKYYQRIRGLEDDGIIGTLTLDTLLNDTKNLLLER